MPDCKNVCLCVHLILKGKGLKRLECESAASPRSASTGTSQLTGSIRSVEEIQEPCCAKIVNLLEIILLFSSEPRKKSSGVSRTALKQCFSASGPQSPCGPWHNFKKSGIVPKKK